MLRDIKIDGLIDSQPGCAYSQVAIACERSQGRSERAAGDLQTLSVVVAVQGFKTLHCFTHNSCAKIPQITQTGPKIYTNYGNSY